MTVQIKSTIFLFFILSVSYSFAVKPTDPKATPETVKLYQNLMKHQSKGLMFGHQDALAYGEGWVYEEGRSDVKDVCGDYPAVYGWELGHLELGDAYSLDSVHFDKIQNWIKIVYERGGVNTISWHLRNPLTGGTSWDVSSKEVVKSILPGGSKHEVFKGYLDKLATFLLALKTDDEPTFPSFSARFMSIPEAGSGGEKIFVRLKITNRFGNLPFRICKTKKTFITSFLPIQPTGLKQMKNIWKDTPVTISSIFWVSICTIVAPITRQH
jgi:hypothetical protein